MIEITLTLVILILCGLLGWQDYNNRKERKSLLNMLVSKNATDFANLELADKTKIEVKPEQKQDLVDMSQLSDDDWEKAILNEK